MGGKGRMINNKISLASALVIDRARDEIERPETKLQHARMPEGAIEWGCDRSYFTDK